MHTGNKTVVCATSASLLSTLAGYPVRAIGYLKPEMIKFAPNYSILSLIL